MCVVMRDKMRKFLMDQWEKFGKITTMRSSERVKEMMDWMQQASGLNDRQPVLLRRDEDGLFAILPWEQASGMNPFDEMLSVLWCVGDTNSGAVFTSISMQNSTEVVDAGEIKTILNFLEKVGYTNLYVTSEVPTSN